MVSLDLHDWLYVAGGFYYALLRTGQGLGCPLLHLTIEGIKMMICGIGRWKWILLKTLRFHSYGQILDASEYGHLVAFNV